MRETAYALGALGCGPAEMVLACRRILERHPDCTALWWLCAHLLTSADQAGAGWRVVEMLESDGTADHLAVALAPEARVLTLGAGATVAAGLGRRPDVAVWVVDSRFTGPAMAQYLECRGLECAAVQPEAMAAALGAVDLVVLEAEACSPTRMIASMGSTPLLSAAGSAGVPVWVVAPAGVEVPDLMLSAIHARRSAGDRPVWEADHELVDLSSVARRISGGTVAPAAPELCHMP